MKRIFLVLFALVAAGCTSIKPVSTTGPTDVGQGITVTPQTAWTSIKLNGDAYWTVDGIGLDELHFYVGIKEGQPLFSVPGVSDKDLGHYQSKMLPNDVQDLMVTTLEKARFENVRPDRLRPCPFGSATGYCFDLTMANPDGLLLKGRVIAYKSPVQLDILFFFAPSEYYFDSMASAADQVFSSIQIR
jgi:hypothetical protein